MKKFFILLPFLATTVFAQTTAQVLRVEPRYITVNEQQCKEVLVERPGNSGNNAGGVLGAIAGAALGNQVGGGSGRDIATVVGGVIGYQVGKGDAVPPTVDRRVQCTIVPTQIQRGEVVTFRYNNRTFSQIFE